MTPPEIVVTRDAKDAAVWTARWRGRDLTPAQRSLRGHGRTALHAASDLRRQTLLPTPAVK